MTAVDTRAVVIAPPDTPRDEWLAVRRQGVGSSDAAAVVGLDPYRSPLAVYLDKLGELPDRDENEAIECGILLEPIVAELFARRTGHTVIDTPGTLQHPDREWQLANVDRLVCDNAEHPATTTALLECKTTSAYRAREWDPAAEEAPAPAILQVQHSLAVTGLPRGYLAALIGGNTFRWFTVERDDDLIEHLTQREADFWQHVVDRNPPSADHRDVELLAHVYDVAGDSVTVLDPAEFRPLKAAYDHAAALEREAVRAKDAVKARLLQILGDAELGVLDGRAVVTNKPTTRRSYTVAETTYRSLRFPKEQ